MNTIKLEEERKIIIRVSHKESQSIENMLQGRNCIFLSDRCAASVQYGNLPNRMQNELRK